ncbi:hypothetical protein [Paracoccus alkenifer]|uniref:hypothetical protein n=1 Tax=Paracoccus alkenifer TaxID=65735 RepID=UPI000B880046|nr:hypothetical protein [Paracoccus alkenifer]
MNITDVLIRIDERLAEMKVDGRGMSDRSLSLEATGSTDTIRNWRRQATGAKPTAGANIATIAKVARALNVSADWLLTGEGERSLPQSQIISDIIQALPELTPVELETVRAAVLGLRDRHPPEEQ